MNELHLQEEIALIPRLRYREVAGEGVLVNLDSGRAIVVNEVGLYIVQQLKMPKTRQALTMAITNHFSVDTNQAATDLELYLAEMDQEQLLERHNV